MDVVTNMAARKCTLIRRVIAKRPHELWIYRDMIRLHAEKGTKGATLLTNDEAQTNGILAGCQPAPHPTRGTRADWKPTMQANDPIAFLLNDLHHMGAMLNTNLQILMFNEPPIDIIAVPYQYLYLTVLEAGVRSRTKAAEGTKTNNSNLNEIIFIVFKCI